MKKIIFALLIGTSLISCSKIEDAINKRIDNIKDSLANEISLKRPSDEFCNPMSKTQDKAAEMIDENTFEGEFADEFSIIVKLEHEEATLVNIETKKSTQKAKTQKQFMLPNSIWIGKVWVPIINLGDGKSPIFKERVDFSEINIPENFVSIQANAMRGLSSVEIINFPSTLTSIGESAFEDCSNIKTLKFSDNLTSIANAFKGCNSLTDISFANTPNNPLIILELLKNFVDEQLSKLTLKIPEDIVDIVIKAIKEDEVLSQKIDKIAGIQTITPEPSPSQPIEEEIIKCTSIEIDENIELPFNKTLEVKTLPANHKDELTCQIIAGEGDLSFSNGQINSGTTDGIYILVFTCGDVVKTSRIFVNKNYGKTFATGISAETRISMFSFEEIDFPQIILNPQNSIIDENSIRIECNGYEDKLEIDNENQKIYFKDVIVGLNSSPHFDIYATANGKELHFDKSAPYTKRLFLAIDNNFYFPDRNTILGKEYTINIGFVSKNTESQVTNCDYYLHLDFDSQYFDQEGKTLVSFGEYNAKNEEFDFPECLTNFNYQIISGQDVATIELNNTLAEKYDPIKFPESYLQIKINGQKTGTISFYATFKLNNHFIKLPFNITIQ